MYLIKIIKMYIRKRIKFQKEVFNKKKFNNKKTYFLNKKIKKRIIFLGL